MKTKFAVVIAAALASSSAIAGTIVTPNPGATTNEMGARLRWGNTGFEAGLRDGSTAANNLNPSGTPVWQIGQGRKFEVSFDSSTGTLGLKVDFDGDNSFGAGETLSKSSFVAPGATDYTGLGFKYIMISGNESGSTGRSDVSDLVINGTSHSTLTPGGLLLDTFYKDAASAVMTNILITGKLTFTAAGTSDERPSWNFTLRDAGAPVVVPLPAAAWSGLGLLGAIAGASHLRKRIARA